METELVRQHGTVSASDFMPILTIDMAIERKAMMNKFIASVLKEGEDYGKLPGGERKCLMKPGAEKLCSMFGLVPTFAEDKIIEDWTGADHAGEPLFYYSYRCQLARGDRYMGEGIGSCNSWESKYRYRWVSEKTAALNHDLETLQMRGGLIRKFEPDFALNRKEMSGKYGKPAEYWAAFEQAIQAGTAKRATKTMKDKEFTGWEISVDEKQYRIPNPDVSDQVNTCQKMGQKRALIAAVLVVTNVSDAFTQDLEDQLEEPSTYHGQPEDIPEQAPAPKATRPAEKPLPTELLADYEAIGRAKGEGRAQTLKDVYNKLADAMITKYGARGNEAYERTLVSLQKQFPSGPQKMKDVQIILTELWEAGQMLDEPLEVQ